MNEIEVRNDVKDLTPEQLGGEIRLLTAQARRMALSYGIQIGYRLKVAHDKVGPHGWAEWLKRETDFSAAAASRFEKLYEGYGADQGSLFGVKNNFPTLENISISNALRLLAVPEEEREQVAVELDAEHISTRELEKALAERDEAKAAAKKAIDEMTEILRAAQDDKKRAEEDRDAAEAAAEKMADEREALQEKLEAAEKRAVEDAGPYKEKLAEAQRQIRQLESRPVEVAVERDEEAIRQAAEDAKKAAEDKAKADMDKLRAKLEKAEKAREKAEKDAEEAAKRSDEGIAPYTAEAEKARQEAEGLRKQLLKAESGAAVAAALFSMAQQNFNSALEKVVAMKATHPDTADKLLGGMELFLTSLVEKVKGERG